MNELKNYLVPYIISNTLSILCIVGAMRKPIWTRIFLASFFLWASYINSFSAIKSPEIYLDYGRLSDVPVYKNFIYGFFSGHINQFIIPVAIGQFFIFAGLTLNKIWTRLACMGGILFGLAIAPLGVARHFLPLF